jgi:hypothetical protein
MLCLLTGDLLGADGTYKSIEGQLGPAKPITRMLAMYPRDDGIVGDELGRVIVQTADRTESSQ